MSRTVSDLRQRMSGKIALVTGATGGIGKATAFGLVALGAQVGIVGRDLPRTESAAADIRAQAATRGVDGQVDTFVADMSVQDDVRGLAHEVLDSYPHLDVLINNVGGYWATRHVTVDGLEHTFALNYLSPFLLTNLLLDRLRTSDPARVVTVASNAQAQGQIDFADLQGEHEFSGGRAYSQSKLATVLFTYELARRLQGTGVTANALHPGVVRTSFGAEDPTKAMKVLLPLALPFMKTPAKGAVTAIHLASAPELQAVSGQYFANRRPKSTSERSYDEAVAARLWELSADLVGLDESGLVRP